MAPLAAQLLLGLDHGDDKNQGRRVVALRELLSLNVDIFSVSAHL